MKTKSWEELQIMFEKYRTGDSLCVRSLFENLQYVLLKFCHFKGKSNIAEDLVQQILLKIHISRDDFDNEKNLKSWVFSIAQNQIIDHWRSDKEKFSKHTNEDEIDTFHQETNQLLEVFEDKNYIEQILIELAPIEASLLRLYYIEEFSIKEIASMISMKESAIKVRIHRIIKGIKEKNEYH